MGALMEGTVCVVLMLLGVGLATTPDPHGAFPHGVKNIACDNAQVFLEVDWDPFNPHSSENYTCRGATLKPKYKPPFEECQTKDEMLPPRHICYPTPIHYEDRPPRSGPHRTLWPVYGEYLFLPTQRWLHSLEHGAVAFLYHPCADRGEVEIVRNVLTNCIRKHVITPYDLPIDQPLALVSWGCRVMMTRADRNLIKQFIKSHAMKGRENRVVSDGQYAHALVTHSHIVSDLRDTNLCPLNPKPAPVDLENRPDLVRNLYRLKKKPL